MKDFIRANDGHDLRQYHAPAISYHELFLEGMICASLPLAVYTTLDPWIEETYDEDIVLIQDR